MKLVLVALTTAAAFLSATAAVTKASILNKGRTVHDAEAAPRKLSLYTRTEDVKENKATTVHVEQLKDPIIAASGGMAPLPASTLSGINPQQQQAGGALTGGECHPKCWWSCGTADCDEVCDPVCAPPQCETACAAIALATCRQKCLPPKCAIVCPGPCAHGGCPNCKTICAPPKCTTQCSEQCESKCAEPQCTWKCNPGQCEKPRCSLTCGGAKVCGLDGNLNARPPPFSTGMTVLSKGLASTDPKSLAAFAAAGNTAAGGAAPMPPPGGKAPAPPGKPIR